MKYIVTGAAGFVGTNLTLELSKRGEELLLIDDLSRPGVKSNCQFIEGKTSEKIHVLDITETDSLVATLETFGEPDMVVNLAGQVSLLASIRDPIKDFLINVQAPLLMLEYFRKKNYNPIFLNLSSNKVYGDLSEFELNELDTRFVPKKFKTSFDENTQLNFHGPYGCSKGSIDQYLIDYARIYGMRTISFRQSTIYGPHQQPASDQGWIAHIIDQVFQDNVVKLNGNGKQVRDILYVTDLINLILLIPQLDNFPFGLPFNVGGGEKNTLSILELFSILETEFDMVPRYKFGSYRPGDQKYYVSDIERISKYSGWKPYVGTNEGIRSVIYEKINS